MNLQLIFSDREMEDFLKKLGYEIKTENEIDGTTSNTEHHFLTEIEKRKYASKEGIVSGRLESIFWQELKKKLLGL
jgi:hypothetical protein